MAEAAIYLTSFLAPLEPYLIDPTITDIYINRDQEVWVEQLGGESRRIEAPKLTETALLRLARQIAASNAQGISREHPLLAARLPDGARIQIILPPATRGSIVFAIRKHVVSGLSLDDYAGDGAFESLTNRQHDLTQESAYTSLAGSDAVPVLRDVVRSRRNILISGGTSSGKTTFLNALLQEIDLGERLILIEDTPELDLIHQNAIGLVAARSELSEPKIDADDLLIAALRMRPDRIILGELRGTEAFTFLRAVNTGHPGSMTTIHADTPTRAIEQLALLVLQAGTQLRWEDVQHYVRASIDCFVQLERVHGKRLVSQVLVRSAMV